MLNQPTAEPQPRLVLVDLTSKLEDGLASALTATSESWAARSMTRIAEAQVFLESNPASHVIVVFPDPVGELGEKLAQGLDPADALVDWQAQVSSLINLHSTFGDRAIVVSEDAALTDLPGLFERVERRSGIKLEAATNLPAPPEEPSSDPIGFQVAARQLLSLPRPIELLHQLDTIWNSDGEQADIPHLVANFLATYTNLLDAREEARVLRTDTEVRSSELARLRTENKMIIEQLHKTQEELERRVYKQRELNNKVAGMRRGREYRRKKIADLTTELTVRQEKIDWLRSARNHHRGDARQLRAERRDHQERAKVVEGELRELKAELQRLKSSRVWRYAKVARKIVRVGDSRRT